MSEINNLGDLYRDIVLDHYSHPRGRTPIVNPDIQNEGLNPTCGDEVKISLLLADNRIKAVSVNGKGCAISMAAGSMLAEILPGKTIDDAMQIVDIFREMMHHGTVIPSDIDIGDLDSLLGVRNFPVRIKCALLATMTLSDAIKSWPAKNIDHKSQFQNNSEIRRDYD